MVNIISWILTAENRKVCRKVIQNVTLSGPLRLLSVLCVLILKPHIDIKLKTLIYSQ